MSSLFPNSDIVAPESAPKSQSAQSSGARLYPASNMVADVADSPAAKRQTLLGDTDSPNSTSPSHPLHRPASNGDGDGDVDSIQVPPTVAELRKSASPYDPVGTYRSVLGLDAEGKPTTTAILPRDMPAPVVREVAQMLRDVDLAPSEAEVVLRAMKTPAPPETREQWARDTERYLETISDADAQAAVKLLDRDPRVAALLERTGAGDHPEVVRLIVEKARRERERGRL